MKQRTASSGQLSHSPGPGSTLGKTLQGSHFLVDFWLIRNEECSNSTPPPPTAWLCFERNLRLLPKSSHPQNLYPSQTVVFPLSLHSSFSKNQHVFMAPHPTSWTGRALTYLSLQEKLKVALRKLRKEQKLAEELEVNTAMKRAAWKASVVLQRESQVRSQGRVQGPRLKP